MYITRCKCVSCAVVCGVWSVLETPLPTHPANVACVWPPPSPPIGQPPANHGPRVIWWCWGRSRMEPLN